jgi:thiol:disulfide interchange protein DsbD
VIWLYDVFVSLVHFDVISWRLNLLFALWFFAFFFMKKVSKNRLSHIVMFMLPLALTIMAMKNLPLRPQSGVAADIVSSNWTPWSEERMNAESGKLIFVDFTAEWCLTCKINKKIVLETHAFNEYAKTNNITLMRADWTKRDDHITQFLKRFGVVGVPAYFIQKADGSIIFLGETISLAKIKASI